MKGQDLNVVDFEKLQLYSENRQALVAFIATGL